MNSSYQKTGITTKHACSALSYREMVLNLPSWIFNLCTRPILYIFECFCVEEVSSWQWNTQLFLHFWVAFLVSIWRIIIAPPTWHSSHTHTPVPFSVIKLQGEKKSFHMGHTELTLNKTWLARQELWKRWKELISKVCRGSNAFVRPPPHHLSSLNNVNGSHKERCRWGPTRRAAHAASSDNTMVIRLTGNESGFGGRLNMRVILPSSGEKLRDYSGWTDKKKDGITTARSAAQHNTTRLGKNARKRAWLLCGFPPTCSGGM